jgi:hypothetical protein
VDASECEMIGDIVVNTPRAMSPLDTELMGIRYEVVWTLLIALIFRAGSSME